MIKVNSQTASLTLPLSPAHKSSITQTQAIGDQVTEFLKNSLQKMPMDSSQKLSSSSMFNSRAFFESQVNYLINLVKQTNVLYQQKETELKQMKKKIKEYEDKMMKYEHESIEEPINKCKQNNSKKCPQQALSIKETKNDDVKTRKKGNQKEVTSSKQKIHKFNNSSEISSFQFTIKSPESEKKSTSPFPQRLMRLETELACAQKLIQHLKEKVQIRQERISKFQGRIRELEENQAKNTRELNTLSSEKTRLELDHKLLKFQFQTLENQYNSAQDIFGKESATNKITIENLRQVLRNLQATKSPKKRSKKEEQGYYSINKKMRQSGDSFSSSSDTSSVNGGYFERNLREENELLRTELIKAFDEKGSMKNELRKYQKLVERMKKQQQSLFQSHLHGNQNDKSFANSRIDQCENSFSSKTFKKNKTSILVVENTEAKEKEIMRRHRMAGLIKQLDQVVNIVTGDKSEQGVTVEQVKPQILQCMINRLKGYTTKRVAFQTLLNKTRQQIEQLKRQKHQIQLNLQQEITYLQNFLNEKSHNVSQIKSEDSTDQAFRDISIGQEKSKSFVLKEKQYIEKINQQDREIIALRNRIISLEEVNQSFYKLTSQNPSSSNFNRSSRQNQLALHSNYLTQQDCSPPFVENALEISSLDLLKQKFTEFYQNTIKELDDWEISTFRNVNSSVRKVPQVKSQVFQPSCRIPQIIQRNVLKISRQFKSIKDIGEKDSPMCIQENCENEFFVNQKMSKSFISSERKSETLEEMMNKRLLEFEQFSTDWIQKVVAKTPNNQDEQQSSVRIQDEAIKQEIQCLSSQKMNFAMTERPSVERQNSFEIDMNEIDAKTESMTSQQLMRERQLFIRQQISYYLPKSESLSNMMNNSIQKKSFHSFRF